MGNDVAALIDRPRAAGLLRSYSQRLANVLRGEPDPEAPAIGTWSLGDVAKHVASGTENYARWIQGRDAPDLEDIRDMAAWNIETVRNLPAAELPDLAERIESATQDLLEAVQEKASRERVRWYAGSNIPVEIVVALRLGEVAVHGLDIAHAARARWEIDPDAARQISYGLAFIGPRFVDPSKLDFDGTIRIRIRGGSDLYYIVQDRTLDVAATGPRPGWTLSVEPTAWVLVSTGRRNQWSAALWGKIIGWGKSPLLPFKLKAASFQG